MTDKNRTVKRIAGFILALLIVVGGFFGIQWVTHERKPLPEAVEALNSDDLLTVTHEPWLTFTPTAAPNTGFIFYPGGRIDPQGYASLLRPIASEGYLVVVPEMPLNIAAMRPNIADKIIAEYPDIDHWVIGGHSVGGAMAIQYTHEHREAIDGLVIWASYAPDPSDISSFELSVALIYGTLDPRVHDIGVAERKHLLPEDTVYVRIEGGGHNQFGAYELEPEDHQATISRESQYEQIIQATLDLMKTVSDTE